MREKKDSLLLRFLRLPLLFSGHSSLFRIQALPFDSGADVDGHRWTTEVLAAADEIPAQADGGEACEDDGGVVHALCSDGKAVSKTPTC